MILAAAAIACVASPAAALEKTRVRLDDDSHGDAWRGASTCSIIYYNTCTGWIYGWSDWSPSDIVGVAFDTCCSPPDETGIGTTWVYFTVGSPAGYGFTGTMEVWDANADCPTGTSLASQAFLPASGWNAVDFGGTQVPDDTFALTTTFGPSMANPAEIATDHPAAVAPEAPACGTCYPVSRVNHTFYWGTSSSIACPGSALNDGVCDAQLIWDVTVTCTPPTPVQQTTWGQVKNLYR
jgi:hypothetical protein